MRKIKHPTLERVAWYLELQELKEYAKYEEAVWKKDKVNAQGLNFKWREISALRNEFLDYIFNSKG